MWDVPQVLIVNLKRMERFVRIRNQSRNRTSNASENQKVHYGFKKNNVFIQFPVTGLDMSPYVQRGKNLVGSKGKYLYDLQAVSVHSGQCNDGHYTAYARKEGKWYWFDDKNVLLAREKDIYEDCDEACVLFYRKRM